MSNIARSQMRRSQAERTAATSASLIAATISALYEKGYAATSTTLVAELAGVSRGAMLHHFPTKVHLMAATIYAIYENELSAYAATILKYANSNERLDRLIDTAWSCFKSPGGIAQTEVWMATRSNHDLAAAVIPVHNAIVRQSIAGLKSVFGTDTLDNHHKVEHILTYLVSALRGLALQHVLGSPEDELTTGVDLVKATIRSLTAPSFSRDPATVEI